MSYSHPFRRSVALAIGVLLCMLPGTRLQGDESTLHPGGQQISLKVGELTRTCFVHVPGSGVGPLPLVIVLHGSRGSGHGMEGYTGFSLLGDREHFVVAYPDGMVDPKSWNSLYGHVPGGEGILGDEIDDVAFIRALIAHLRQNLKIDATRVYACGFSAGGYMAYRLGMEMPGELAAVAPVCGSLGIKCIEGKPVLDRVPEPRGPISLLHISGGQDHAVKIEGNTTPKNQFLPAADCVSRFVKVDGCNPAASVEEDKDHEVTRTLYTGGKDGAEVEFVVVHRSGHGWPLPRMGFGATEELWKFFSKHHL